MTRAWQRIEAAIVDAGFRLPDVDWLERKLEEWNENLVWTAVTDLNRALRLASNLRAGGMEVKVLEDTYRNPSGDRPSWAS